MPYVPISQNRFCRLLLHFSVHGHIWSVKQSYDCDELGWVSNTKTNNMQLHLCMPHRLAPSAYKGARLLDNQDINTYILHTLVNKMQHAEVANSTEYYALLNVHKSEYKCLYL